jgi:hypothetical protein
VVDREWDSRGLDIEASRWLAVNPESRTKPAGHYPDSHTVVAILIAAGSLTPS